MKIETHDLVKTYGERTVVNHVNVTVEQGKIVGLLGPNGAGKTTTFYMIVGIIRPDEGQVTVDGAEITDMPIHMRPIYSEILPYGIILWLFWKRVRI